MSSRRRALAVTAAAVATVLSASAPLAIPNAAGPARAAPATARPAAAPSPSPTPRSATGGGTLTRVSGADGIATAIAISKLSYPMDHSAKALVIATSDDFADALAGTPLAVQLQGPILVTTATGLTPEVSAEAERVLPVGGTVYVLGGLEAVSSEVDTELTALSFNPVRVSGLNRYDTAVKIAQLLGSPPTIFEADGTNFPDGLSAGPAAALSRGAILFTDGSVQATETTDYVGLHPKDTRYAIGGPAATADPAAQRVVGVDRYATSVAVARDLFAPPSVVVLSSGEQFPDALTGGPLAALSGAPLILVPGSGPLPSSVQAYLNLASNSVLTGLLLGGQDTVSAATATLIAHALVLVPPDS